MEALSGFGHRLMLSRLNKSLSQDQLGERVGLSGQSIARLERERGRRIEIDLLRQLCLVLEVSADWLLELPARE